MERRIVGYHIDEAGDWVAHLACGHRQHVRHRPPFSPRDWITTAEGRASRLETPLECPLCDRAELPDNLTFLRRSDWDEESMPKGLRRAHRLAEGIWAVLRVESGRLEFRMGEPAPQRTELAPGVSRVIPPGMEHDVTPFGPVRFSVEFSKVELPSGDAACWVGEVCPDCGGVRHEGHRSGCPQLTGAQ